MSRINTNISSLLAQRILGQQNAALNKSLERLSTGVAINRGADNPAGLIASENLRSEKAALSAAIGNAERADQVVNIAEGGLQEISGLLVEIRSLVGQSANGAGLSLKEKEANQLEIDSILSTIDRIASSTSFQGSKLLNGSFDFTIRGQNSLVTDVQVNGAKLAFGENRDVQVMVTQSAQHAGLFLSTNGNLLINGDDPTAQFVIEVAGKTGSREFSFASATTTSAMRNAINTFTSVTGVSATVSAIGGGVLLKSTGFGDSQFVSVKVVNDGGIAGGIARLSATNENTVSAAGFTSYATAQEAVRDEGQDVGAIINGTVAVTNGTTAKLATDFLDVRVELSVSGAQTLQTIDALTITGGGAVFNLGPNVDIINRASIGIGSVAARNLGSASTGYLDDLGSGKSSNLVDGDLATGQNIVDEAINKLSSLRGRLGAFQKNVVGSTIRSLSITLENTSAAESNIRDTDFAVETAALTRAQILVNAATSVLALANAQPQSVLALLG